MESYVVRYCILYSFSFSFLVLFLLYLYIYVFSTVYLLLYCKERFLTEQFPIPDHLYKGRLWAAGFSNTEPKSLTYICIAEAQIYLMVKYTTFCYAIVDSNFCTAPSTVQPPQQPNVFQSW